MQKCNTKPKVLLIADVLRLQLASMHLTLIQDYLPGMQDSNGTTVLIWSDQICTPGFGHMTGSP